MGAADETSEIWVNNAPASSANPVPVTGTTAAQAADTAIGTTADGAVVTDTTGTLSGKLRGLVKILADVWDSTLHALKVRHLAGASTSVADISVDGTAGGVSLLAANANRTGATIQNTGAANMRVTYDGNAPTATRGLQLGPGDALVLKMPNCPTGAVKGIRESSTSTTAAVEETV